MVSLDWYGVGVIAFLAASLVVGTLTSRLVKKSSRRYMVAGKSLPLFFVGTMLAAQSIDGNSSLGNVSLVYQFGFWAGAVIPIGLAVCLILTGAFYAKKLNKMSMLTLPDFYYRRFGAGPEGISAILMMISFIVLVAGNFAASGFILSAVLHIDFFWAMLIAALVVLVYTFAGGLFSSAYTDIFQIYLAIGAFWAAFIFFAGGFSGVDFGAILGNAPPSYLDLSGLTDMGNGALINWAGILSLGLGDIVALDFMERVFAADGGRTAQKSCYMAAGLTMIILVPTTMIGIIGHTIEPNIADPFTLYPIVAVKHVPEVIGILMLVSTVSCGMSTANGGTLAIASVLSRNILQRNILRKVGRKLSDRQLLIATRVLVIPMFFTAFALGALIPRPGTYLILAFDIVLAGCFVPLVLGTYWKKATASGAVASIAVGSAVRLVLYFLITTAAPTSPYAAYGGLDTMIPPLISLVVFISVSLATQKRTPPRPDVVYLIPSDGDVVSGADVSEWVKPVDVRQVKNKK